MVGRSRPHKIVSKDFPNHYSERVLFSLQIDQFLQNWGKEKGVFIQLVLSILYANELKLITCFVLRLPLCKINLFFFFFFFIRLVILLLCCMCNFRTWHETCFYVYFVLCTYKHVACTCTYVYVHIPTFTYYLATPAQQQEQQQQVSFTGWPLNM